MKNDVSKHNSQSVEVVQKTIGKEEVCFAILYQKLYKSTHRYGMHLINDAFTIDNIVQEAFLKLWEHREQMTSLLHASRFLKQNVRWECHAYFRSPVSRFHRRFTYLDAVEDCDNIYRLTEPEPDESNTITESQLKVITDMLPFLPSGRAKTFMKLYYVNGISSKQIADRYGMHISAVHLELRHGVGKLKAMIVRPQQVFAAGTAAVITVLNNNKNPVIETGQRIWLYNIEGLNREQSQIYRLRMESKYEFKRIADYLSLPQAYVQSEYVKAWKALSLRKKKTGGKNSNCASSEGTKSYQSKPVLTTFRIA